MQQTSKSVNHIIFQSLRKAFFRAPEGCLQYHTSLSGSLTSFNWPTTMLAAIQYTICVRHDDGYCGVQVAEDSGSIDAFHLDDTLIADGVAVSPKQVLDSNLVLFANF